MPAARDYYAPAFRDQEIIHANDYCPQHAEMDAIVWLCMHVSERGKALESVITRLSVAITICKDVLIHDLVSRFILGSSVEIAHITCNADDDMA